MKGILLAVMVLLLAGCATGSASMANRDLSNPADTLLQANYAAVDKLVAVAAMTSGLVKEQPIIVATLVNIDDLRSSRLGRILSEQISTRLSCNGFSVTELKLRGTIFVKQAEGEFLLSREIKEISANHKAQAVLVGTYAEARGNVYITLKIVGTGSNQIIAAHDYVLPMDANVRSLLWTASR